jgi:hypothetical protein
MIQIFFFFTCFKIKLCLDFVNPISLREFIPFFDVHEINICSLTDQWVR